MSNYPIKKLPLCFLLAFTSCQQKQQVEKVNFKDTVYSTKIFYYANGDTSQQHIKFYFSPTDPTIDTSGFFYTACNRPCSSSFRIYFPKDRVISFCDSILKAMPPENTSEVVYYERIPYEHIKKQALNNRIDETIYADELEILLDRFSPFILHPATKEKPAYIILKHELQRESEYKLYIFRTNSGDTVTLGGRQLRLAPIEYEGLPK